MEQWSVGVLDLLEIDLFLQECCKAEHKVRPPSILNPQSAITPQLPGF
jgi:hypothetical protein